MFALVAVMVSVVVRADHHYIPCGAVERYEGTDAVILQDRTGRAETRVGGTLVRDGGDFLLTAANVTAGGRLVLNGGGLLTLTNNATFKLQNADEVVVDGGTFRQERFTAYAHGVEMSGDAHVLVKDGSYVARGTPSGSAYGQVFRDGSPYIRVEGGTAEMAVTFQKSGEALFDILSGTVKLRSIANGNRSGSINACGRICVHGASADISFLDGMACYSNASRTAYPYFFDFRLEPSAAPGGANVSAISWAGNSVNVAGLFRLTPAGGLQVVQTNEFRLIYKTNRSLALVPWLGVGDKPLVCGAETPVFDIGIPSGSPHLIRAALKPSAVLQDGVVLPGEGVSGGFVTVAADPLNRDLRVRLLLSPKGKTLADLAADLRKSGCSSAVCREGSSNYNLLLRIPAARFARDAESKVLLDFTEVPGAVAAKTGQAVTNALIRAVRCDRIDPGFCIVIGTPLPAPAPAPTCFHVAEGVTPTEAPDGSAANPFENLRQALAAARHLPNEPVDIVLLDGTYRLPSALSFTKSDRRTERTRLCLRAANDGGARLTQAKVVPPGLFAAVTDPAALSRIPEAGRSTAVVADLSSLDVQLPTVATIKSAFKVPNVPEVFFNGRRMYMAGWPDQVDETGEELPQQEWWAHIGRDDVVERGYNESNASKGGPGVFRYAGGRPERWGTAPYVLMNGYWYYDWADQFVPAGTIDTTAKTIALANRVAYGLGTPSSWYSNMPPRRWRAVHLLEELDRPGEYFLDCTEKRLYLIPPVPLTDATCVEIAEVGSNPLIKASGSSHLVFKGLRLSESNSGASLTDVVGVTFDHVMFSNLRTDGLSFEAACDCRVTGCDFADLGVRGVQVNGGDRRTLTPGGNVISDCLFTRMGVHQRTYAPAVALKGVEDVATHLFISDIPCMAVCDDGNDCLFEWSVLSNCCNTTDDAGAVYRYADVTRRGNRFEHTYLVDCATNGVQGTAAVYYDGGSGGDILRHNVFRRSGAVDTAKDHFVSGSTPSPDNYGGFGAVFLNGGYHFKIEDNCFVDCPRAFSMPLISDEQWRKDVKNQERYLFGDEVCITNEPFASHYPEMATYWPGEPLANRSNLVERSTLVCTPSVMRLKSPIVARETQIYADKSSAPQPDVSGMGLLTPRSYVPKSWSGR